MDAMVTRRYARIAAAAYNAKKTSDFVKSLKDNFDNADIAQSADFISLLCSETGFDTKAPELAEIINLSQEMQDKTTRAKQKAALKAEFERLIKQYTELKIDLDKNDDLTKIQEKLCSDEFTLIVPEADYTQLSASANLDAFLKAIEKNGSYIPTGFLELDKVLDGGLFEGLYTLGAISSLGKTTFILQVADNIARRGQDVLYFSLEMSRYELMAKSLSRLTVELGNAEIARTTRQILCYKKHLNFSAAEKEIFFKALATYKEQYSEHIFISEGVGNLGVREIRKAIENHIFHTKKTPVVIIDYLQILAPYSEHMTDKQNTDKSVLELKRLSRDYKVPILIASSFNRENYEKKVSMRAFKESGAIEYSSDVLLGLQLKGASDNPKNTDQIKQQFPRPLELVVLKNRNGAINATINLEYNTRFNFFSEVSDKQGEI